MFNSTDENNGSDLGPGSSHSPIPLSLISSFEARPDVQFVPVELLPWPGNGLLDAAAVQVLGAVPSHLGCNHPFTPPMPKMRGNSLKTRFIIFSTWPEKFLKPSFLLLCNMFLRESTQALKTLASVD